MVGVDPLEASTESGPRPDGSVDSGTDSGLPCGEPNVVLCDDFERTTGIGPWTKSNGSPDGVVATTTDDARRGARSLRALTTSTDDFGSAFYTLDEVKVATKRVEYRFSLRVLGSAANGTLGQVNTISVKKGSDFWRMYVHVQDYGVYLAEQFFPNGASGQYSQHKIPEIVQGGPWVDVVVQITIGAPSKLRVTVGGKESFASDSETGIPSGVVSALAGIGFQGKPHPRGEVFVDDAVLIVE